MPTVAQLKAQVRVHNKKNCIRLSQKKAALANDLARVKGGGGEREQEQGQEQEQEQEQVCNRKLTRKRNEYSQCL